MTLYCFSLLVITGRLQRERDTFYRHSYRSCSSCVWQYTTCWW